MNTIWIYYICTYSCKHKLEDGKAVLPKALDEYNRMRESSPLYISEFNKETNLHLCNRINNEENNDTDAIQEPYLLNSNQENNVSVPLFQSQLSMASSSSLQNNETSSTIMTGMNWETTY